VYVFKKKFFFKNQNKKAWFFLHCLQENGASVILRDIARARENIQKSLAGVSTRGPRTHGLVLGQTACLIGFLRFFFSPFKKATTKTFSTADYFGLWSKLGHKV
jgi:hypothetical protein